MKSIISKLLAFFSKTGKPQKEINIEPLPKGLAADLGQRVFSMAEKFRRQCISESTSKAMLNHQSAGFRMSAKLPFGWKPDPNNDSLLVQDPAEQLIIEQIVASRKEGLSFRKIGEELETSGILSRSGRRLHQSLIRKILARAERRRGK